MSEKIVNLEDRKSREEADEKIKELEKENKNLRELLANALLLAVYYHGYTPPLLTSALTNSTRCMCGTTSKSNEFVDFNMQNMQDKLNRGTNCISDDTVLRQYQSCMLNNKIAESRDEVYIPGISDPYIK